MRFAPKGLGLRSTVATSELDELPKLPAEIDEVLDLPESLGGNARRELPLASISERGEGLFEALGTYCREGMELGAVGQKHPRVMQGVQPAVLLILVMWHLMKAPLDMGSDRGRGVDEPQGSELAS